MNFHLVKCDLHGWIVFDETIRKGKNVNLQCPGGHMLSTDTRDLPLYQAEIADLPDNSMLPDARLNGLRTTGKLKPALHWFAVTLEYTCTYCGNKGHEKITLSSPHLSREPINERIEREHVKCSSCRRELEKGTPMNVAVHPCTLAQIREKGFPHPYDSLDSGN